MKYLDAFPIINCEELLDEIKEQKFYHTVYISEFDHWLSEDEAETQCVFYSKNDKSMLKKYYEYEDLFLKSFSEIYDGYEIFDISSEIHNEEQFSSKKISTKNSFIKICKASLREQCFFFLAIPQKATILIGNYDLVTIVLTRKGWENHQEELCNLFLKNDLYVIS
jgi:hypothetical protein